MSAPERPAGTGAELLDALASAALAAVRPIEFRTTQSPEELEGAFQLRHRVAVEGGLIRPEELPGGLERDNHDDVALQLAGWNGSTLIATIRLVFGTPGRKLPTEELFDALIEPGERVVDWGRLSIAPEYRDHEHRMFWAVIGAAWLVSRARGFRLVVGTSSGEMIDRYRAAGFPIKVLGPPRWHWGKFRYPMIMDPAEIDTSAGKAAPSFTV
jgi:hypothetical protein